MHVNTCIFISLRQDFHFHLSFRQDSQKRHWSPWMISSIMFIRPNIQLLAILLDESWMRMAAPIWTSNLKISHISTLKMSFEFLGNISSIPCSLRFITAISSHESTFCSENNVCVYTRSLEETVDQCHTLGLFALDYRNYFIWEFFLPGFLCLQACNVKLHCLEGIRKFLTVETWLVFKSQVVSHSLEKCECFI